MRKPTTFILLFVFFFSFVSLAQELQYERSLNPSSSPRELIELGYDGENTGGIGAAGADFMVAAKFTPSMLAPYVDKGLVKIKFFIYSPPVGNSVTVKVWAAGTASAPGTELVSQTATVTSQAWNTVTLTNPVIIPNADLWIGVRATSGPTGSQFWAGNDAGPNHPNGQFMYWSNAWTTLIAVNPALTYNWSLRGIIDTNVPVELSSFSGSCVNGSVKLNWATASEVNNRGFEIQRKSANNDFVTIAFVNGMGSTTETTRYTYSDQVTVNGKYTYRLKQIDLNGNFEYSNEIEVDAQLPAQFSLNQNYPNPFNPSTVINFSLAVDSRVSLRVFNVLGQEVKTLFKGNLSAGNHDMNLNLSGSTSGIYFYQLEAAGTDGSAFKSIKKMTLSK